MDSETLYALLRQAGCDVEGTMRRMMQDRTFYLHLLESFYQEQTWESLQKALENEDYDAAFQAAHLIKGSAATLGLTEIYKAVSRVVEKLRQSPDPSACGQKEMSLTDPDYLEFRMQIRRFVKLYQSCL
ncbi:MAG: Hpt domain-containing protein [Blautia sp.]|nr:Hpt domain-containing protein [Blautia sp.]